MILRHAASAILLALMLHATAFAADVDQKAIPWSGAGADKSEIRFDPQHLQRPALLLFWATWCPYCEALMPYVQKVYDAAGKDKLDVYAIDIKEDGDPIADLYGVKGTPGVFLVDRNGTIVYKRISGDAPEKVEVALREKLALPR